MSDPTHIVCPACSAINRVPNSRLGQHPVCGKCKKPLFNAKPIDLTDSSFDRFIGRSELPVVVDFWAEWCGPCRMMAPAFAAVAARAEPFVILAKINTEQAQAVAARYSIRSIPTIIAFRGGKEISRQSGALSEAALWQYVQSIR